MILKPNVIVLYVDDLTRTSQFYQDLLGIKPEEASPTFVALDPDGHRLRVASLGKS